MRPRKCVCSGFASPLHCTARIIPRKNLEIALPRSILFRLNTIAKNNYGVVYKNWRVTVVDVEAIGRKQVQGLAVHFG